MCISASYFSLFEQGCALNLLLADGVSWMCIELPLNWSDPVLLSTNFCKWAQAALRHTGIAGLRMGSIWRTGSCSFLCNPPLCLHFSYGSHMQEMFSTSNLTMMIETFGGRKISTKIFIYAPWGHISCPRRCEHNAKGCFILQTGPEDVIDIDIVIVSSWS